MRIFVSSSFEDLREHRAAAIRILRQLGHQVLAMEDMTAGSATPLAKVLDMVDRSEAYLGVFAWRYGHVPTKADQPNPPPEATIAVDGEVDGETSITEYEYRRAKKRELPIIAFLLDETYPWPPQFIDGIYLLKRSLQVKDASDVGPNDLENMFLQPRGFGHKHT